MIDLTPTIAPKSDQLNADDLIAGPMTIRITNVSANPSSPEQPVSISFDGDNGKPYKPCKSMRRVLVSAWGKDGTAYIGRSMTLYRDPRVTFGGIEVGGIRISHMSDIDRDMSMSLTASRTKRLPYVVKRLDVKKAASEGRDWRAWASEQSAKIAACKTLDALDALEDEIDVDLFKLRAVSEKAADAIEAKIAAKKSALPGDDDDMFPGDTPAEEGERV